jgi:hypothetical protein
VVVTVKLAASEGYISYRYQHNPVSKTIKLQVTGSGDLVHVHMLLPEGVDGVQKVVVNGLGKKFLQSRIEQSDYVDFDISLPEISDIVIQYSL